MPGAAGLAPQSYSSHGNGRCRVSCAFASARATLTRAARQEELAELARVPRAVAEHIRRCCFAQHRADLGKRHDAPAKTLFHEWAAESRRARERECAHARVDWPVDGSVLLPHTISGQPKTTRFSTHLCGLDGVRDDNLFHLELLFNGTLWVKTDLVVDCDEGTDIVLPFAQDLAEGSYTLDMRLWVGPQGRDGVLAKSAQSTFVVNRNFSAARATGPAGCARGTATDRPQAGVTSGAAGAGDAAGGGISRSESSDESDEGGKGAEVYSDMRCAGGVQAFPFPLQRADDFWGLLSDPTPHCQTPPDAARQRVCEFENVCWARGAVVFFRDPQLMVKNVTPPHLFIFGEQESGFISLSYLHDLPTSHDVEKGLSVCMCVCVSVCWCLFVFVCLFRSSRVNRNGCVTYQSEQKWLCYVSASTLCRRRCTCKPYIHTNTYISVHIPVYIYMQIYIHLNTLSHTYASVYIHTCTCVCIYVHTHTTHTHTHTHTHTPEQGF